MHLSTLTAMRLHTEERKFKVITVDDDPNIRFLIKIFLRDLCETDEAANGQELFDKISNNTYDIILMDLNLKDDETGLSITEKLHNDPNYEDIPVIAVTSYTGDSIEETCLNNGMSAYISKPFYKSDLIDTINQLL